MVQIQENVLLAPCTTLGIGGPARYFLALRTETDLVEALRFVGEQKMTHFVLGGGSNLLVADSGFPGAVLQLAFSGEPDVRPDGNSVLYDVPAGYSWNSLVLGTCEAGLSGMECLAGIPGTVGASPIQNIGAYGQEVSQTIDSVRVLDLHTGGFRQLSASECGFAYRTSIFNSSHRDHFIVTRVTFRLDPVRKAKPVYADLVRFFEGRPEPSPLEIYAAVRTIRDRKGMLIDPAEPAHPDTRSAGSFFKNPIAPLETLLRAALETGREPSDVPHWPAAPGEVKLAAAWLIEQAGFARGFRLGPVGISSRHTLALTNVSGTATCADLLHLRDTIVAGVQSRFGVHLEQEPVFLS